MLAAFLLFLLFSGISIYLGCKYNVQASDHLPQTELDGFYQALVDREYREDRGISGTRKVSLLRFLRQLARAIRQVPVPLLLARIRQTGRTRDAFRRANEFFTVREHFVKQQAVIDSSLARENVLSRLTSTRTSP